MQFQYSKWPVVLFLVCVTALSAQTSGQFRQITSNYDLESLRQVGKQIEDFYRERKAMALELAEKYGWPVVYEKEDGGVGVLVDVTKDERPIYLETTNYGAGVTARVDHLHTGGSSGLDLDGENMLAGVWDGGSILETHELFGGRAENKTSASSSGHSTHVTGTIIGSGNVDNGDSKGMAPKGNTINYATTDLWPSLVDEMAEGLLVSNHSYGTPPEELPLHELGKYTVHSRFLDELLYDAPHHAAVYSAGNGRNTNHGNPGDFGYDILTRYSVSKNNIVVAATFQVLNYTGPSSVPMAVFSSWGPTDDGRIKPDISAKGVNTRSSLNNTNFSYGNLSGTSMSAPSISGVLLVLQEHYNNVNGQFMKAATAKGLLLHTADEAGNAPGPDYRFGWGLVNALKAAETISNAEGSSLVREENMGEGLFYTFAVDASGLESLMASIAWTDPPGAAVNNEIEDHDKLSLVNDLDIRLIDENGDVHYPWMLDHNNFSAGATKGDNYRDNIEKVEISSASGEYIVTVTHKKDALVNDDQDFSIVMTGIDQKDFFLYSTNGLVEVCDTEDEAIYPINIETYSGFSGDIDFTVSDEPSGVTATLSQTTITDSDNITLTLSGITGLAHGDYPIKITSDNNGDETNLYVVLRVLGDTFSDITLVFPEDGSDGHQTTPVLIWETPDTHVQEYDLQLSKDAAFTDVFFTTVVYDNVYQTPSLWDNTTYYWRVRPRNECSEGEYSDYSSFTTGQELSVNHVVASSSVKIYPNPTSETLYVKTDEPAREVVIFDILGQEMGSYKLTSEQAQIDLAIYQSGVYFVNIILEDGSRQVFKVVKQ